MFILKTESVKKITINISYSINKSLIESYT